MENENKDNGTPVQDEDVILPEGYEDENIFDEPAGDDENIFGKEDTIEGFGDGDEDTGDPAPEDQTQKQEPEEKDGVSAGVDGKSSAPAAEQDQKPAGFRFKNGDQEIEVPESDLPGLYRKAQEHAGLSGELAQARQELEAVNTMAKAMGFENAQAMLGKAQENFRESEIQRLVADGVNEEVARYMVESRMQQTKPQGTQRPPQQTAPPPARDFRREISELMQTHPQLREQLANGGKLPQEVITACVKDGVPLRVAYAEHELKAARAEQERIQRENDILKQNEKNAAKAPVKGVLAGGGAETKGKDPFLEGLLSDE